MIKRTLLISITFLLIGCSNNPQKLSKLSPQEIINNFLINYHIQQQHSNKQGEYDFSANISFQSGTDKLDAKTSIKTLFDLSDIAKPLAELQIQLDGKGGISDQKGELDLDANLKFANEDKVYLSLNKAEIATDDTQVNLILGVITGMYTNKTFFFSLPQTLTSQIKNGTLFAQTKQTLSKEQWENIIQENPFLQYSSTINNRKQIYQVNLDFDHLKGYFSAIAKANGETIQEEDLIAYTQLSDSTTFNIQIGIGKEPDYNLEILKGSIDFIPTAGSTTDGALTFDITFSNNGSKGTISGDLKGEGDPVVANVTFNSSKKEKVSFDWTPDDISGEAEPLDLLGLLGGLGSQAPKTAPQAQQ